MTKIDNAALRNNYSDAGIDADPLPEEPFTMFSNWFHQALEAAPAKLRDPWRLVWRFLWRLHGRLLSGLCPTKVFLKVERCVHSACGQFHRSLAGGSTDALRDRGGGGSSPRRPLQPNPLFCIEHPTDSFFNVYTQRCPLCLFIERTWADLVEVLPRRHFGREVGEGEVESSRLHPTRLFCIARHTYSFLTIYI